MPRMTAEQRAAEQERLKKSLGDAKDKYVAMYGKLRKREIRKKVSLGEWLADIGVADSPLQVRIMKICAALKDDEILLTRIERLIDRKAVPENRDEAAE